MTWQFLGSLELRRIKSHNSAAQQAAANFAGTDGFNHSEYTNNAIQLRSND
jgi:hypothetical protein